MSYRPTQQYGYGQPPPPQQGYQQGYQPQQGYAPQQQYQPAQQYPPQRPSSQSHHSGSASGRRSGVGGFNAPVPAGADPQLWQWFEAVDTDRSGAISAPELRQALLNGDWTNFDLDTVKLLMTIFDVDRSGTITFNEFAGLWKYIKDWQAVFRHFDADRSGSIDRRELDNALRQFGFNLSPGLLDLLEKKYDLHLTSQPQNQASLPDAESHNANRPEGITFDRFVRACVVVKQLTESFRRLDTQGTGWVQMNYDTFMRLVLEAP